MPTRDFASDVSPVYSFDPGVLTATPGAFVTIDLGQAPGYEGLTVLYAIGAGGIVFNGANYLVLAVQHSDDGVTFVDVASTDLVGAPAVTVGGVFKSFKASKAAASVEKVGYKGSKRYLQAQVIFAGVHGTGTPVAAIGLRGFPLKGPVV